MILTSLGNVGVARAGIAAFGCAAVGNRRKALRSAPARERPIPLAARHSIAIHVA